MLDFCHGGSVLGSRAKLGTDWPRGLLGLSHPGSPVAHPDTGAYVAHAQCGLTLGLEEGELAASLYSLSEASESLIADEGPG
jgi:hypothetical protein